MKKASLPENAKPEEEVDMIEVGMASFRRRNLDILSGMEDYEVFTAMCADSLFLHGSKRKFDSEFAKTCMIDGSNDGGIDAVFENPNDGFENEIVMIQGKFYDRQSFKPSDLKAALLKMASTMDNLETSKVEGYSQKLRTAFYSATHGNPGHSTRFVVCFSTDPCEQSLKKMETICSQFSKKYGVDAEIRTRKDISGEVFSAMTDCYSVKDLVLKMPDKSCKETKIGNVALTFVTGKSVQVAYNEHGNSLLGRNLRLHIASSRVHKRIDEDIKDTLRNDPKSFHAHNNGMVISCEGYKVSGNEIHFRNASIVNGGQTYFIIGTTTFDDDVSVVCRIVTKKKGMSESEWDEYSTEIAKHTNRQKQIKADDEVSNDKTLILLKRILETKGLNLVSKKGVGTQVRRDSSISKNEYGRMAMSSVFGNPSGTRTDGGDNMFSGHNFKKLFNPMNSGWMVDSKKVMDSINRVRSSISKDPKINSIYPAMRSVTSYGYMTVLAVISFLAKLEEGIVDIQSIVNVSGKKVSEYKKVLETSPSGRNMLREGVDEGALDALVLRIFKKIAKWVARKNPKNSDSQNLFKSQKTFFHPEEGDGILFDFIQDYTDEDSTLRKSVSDVVAV